MALYRCAACGSPNVVTDMENGGVNYNYVKGAVGTVLLGAGGAMSGIQSKKEQVFKCPDCGLTLKEPMDFEIKTLIDIGVMSAEARKKLKLNGVAIDWEFLTRKYKNIEKGIADEVLQMQASADANSDEIRAQTNRMIAETLMEMKQKTDAEIVIMEHENIDELQQAWELNSAETRTMREKIYNDRVAELDLSFSEKERSLRLNFQRKLAKLEEQVATLNKESANLSEKLSTLGFFKMGEKKKTVQQINEITVQLTDLDGKKTELETENTTIIEDLQKQKKAALLAVKMDIDNTYPLTQSPVERNHQLDYFRKLHNDASNPKFTSVMKDIIFLKEMLCFAFEFYNREVSYGDFDELAEILSFVLELQKGTPAEEISKQRLSAVIRYLVEDGKVKQTEINRKRYFELL